MNRTIKFRAWVESASKMFDWEYLSDKSDLGSVINGGYAGYHPMQFTGLLDKNGVEIYEGDIIEYPDGIGEVEIRDGCWKSCYNSPTDRAFNRPDILKEILFDEEYGENQVEIIGNIYENPELITNE